MMDFKLSIDKYYMHSYILCLFCITIRKGLSPMSDPLVPLPRSDRIAEQPPAASPADARSADEKNFLELRRKVQQSELLSAATERLLCRMKFNGRITVVARDGRVFKSSYEEGYFRRKNEGGCG